MNNNNRTSSIVNKKSNAEYNSNFISQLLFYYLNSLLNLGAQRPLELDDIDDIYPNDKCDINYDKFNNEWQNQININGLENASLIKSLYKSIGRGYWKSIIAYLIFIAFSFAPPLLLNLIVSDLEKNSNDRMDEYKLYILAVLVLIAPIIGSVAFNWHNQFLSHMGIQARAAISSAIFRKSLKLTSYAKAESSTGNIVNLMSTDAMKLKEVAILINGAWASPLQIGVAMYLLYNQIGASAFVGIGFLLLLFPINGIVFAKLAKIRKSVLENADQRVKITSELLIGVRIVKMYAWEQAMRIRIMKIREIELKLIRKAAYIVAIGFLFVLLSAPILLPIIVFFTYTKTGHDLTASKAFTTIALFNLIRFPFGFLPFVLQQIVLTKISLNRIQRFLKHDELSDDSTKQADNDYIDNDTVLSLKDCTFTWNANNKDKVVKELNTNHQEVQIEMPSMSGKDDTKIGKTDQSNDDPFVLNNINMNIKEKSMVAIVGSIGSGKSSILSALLNEMTKVEGEFYKRDVSIAYCSQQAWIMNETVKQNILFNLDFEKDFYDQCISACALDTDLKQLEYGDQTEIGERGINLSGGQKQRISIARSIFNKADVYLFDDVLSAVDAHVGEHIFNNVLSNQGMLKGKTRIIVLNQLQYLSKMDHIIVLKDGQIQEQGTFDQLMSKGLDFSQLIAKHGVEEDDEDENDDHKQLANEEEKSMSKQREEVSKNKKQLPQSKSGKSLMTEEERESGEVKNDAYIYYFKACGSTILIAAMFGFIASDSFRVASDFWLAIWTDEFVSEGSMSTSDIDRYLLIYFAFGMASTLFVMFRALCMAEARVRAARLLHERLFDRVMQGTMKFFDSTPLGRILNRFSRDQEVVDMLLGPAIGQFIGTAMQVFTSLIAISIASQGYFLIPLLFIGIIYHRVQKYFRKSSTEIQRLESLTRSPLFAHFSESLSGLSIIRAYQLQKVFQKLNSEKLDANDKLLMLYQTASNWLSLRLDVIGACIGFCTAIIAVLNQDIDPGLIGLALAYAFQMTGFLKHCVRMAAETEARMNAVERINYYTKNVPQENNNEEIKENWPTNGKIEINDLVVCYNKGVQVLKSINLVINSKAKIGCVGRTGSGKSTLVLSLLRLVESESGCIKIDDVDISKLNLQFLRSHIAVIPQDPLLFSDTIRHNLDPFDKFSDEELNEILHLVHLKAFVDSLPNNLDYLVAEGGENLSVGQRQMICLGRALLRKPKILLLDEASASLDAETDHQIQKTIRECFRECTVLTIAHRLNTIMHSDKILVLDDGNIVEYDEPRTLLQNEKGVLKSMIEAHGSKFADVLTKLADGVDEEEVFNELDEDFID